MRPITTARAVLPNLLRSEFDIARTAHGDLRDTSSRDLYLERLRLQRGLALGVFERAIVPVADELSYVDAVDWALARLANIDSEFRRRRGVRR